MKPDDLDTKTDDQLSEAFALEVAGYEKEHPRSSWFTRPGSNERGACPPFATDANAVLPWLEKCHQVTAVFECGAWFVGIEKERPTPVSFVSSNAPTFARCACIALIRAKRASK